MDGFKLEVFEAGGSRPKKLLSSTTMDEKQTEAIKQRLLHKIATEEPGGDDPSSLLPLKGELIGDCNATSRNFDINDVFKALRIKPHDTVFVNWYYFDDIDAMSYADFRRHFEHLWFLSSDDIDIFDDTYDWIISVNHEGYISFKKL